MTGLVGDVLGSPRDPACAGCGTLDRARQAGSCARYARRLAAPADIFRFLRRDHYRLVGIKRLLALVRAGKIAFHRSGSAKLALAEQRLQGAVVQATYFATQTASDVTGAQNVQTSTRGSVGASGSNQNGTASSNAKGNAGGNMSTTLKSSGSGQSQTNTNVNACVQTSANGSGDSSFLTLLFSGCTDLNSGLGFGR